jgi:hypothetical protein
MDTTQQERLYTVYELQSITDNITSGSLYKRTVRIIYNITFLFMYNIHGIL